MIIQFFLKLAAKLSKFEFDKPKRIVKISAISERNKFLEGGWLLF